MSQLLRCCGMRLFLLSSGKLTFHFFFFISSCYGIINPLISSPASTDPHGTSESAAPLSMMNIAYFVQKLVEKLSSRMFVADPKQILIFIAKQIMRVSHVFSPHFLSTCCSMLVFTLRSWYCNSEEDGCNPFGDCCYSWLFAWEHNSCKL